jgi:monoamine oxidase
VLTETVVESITWRRGKVMITAQTKSGRSTYAAARVLITLPLAVLKAAAGQAGAIEFEPELPRPKLDAMEKLEMGKVIRVVLCFRHRFWDQISPRGDSATLANMSFLFSQDEWFPTWWTTMPQKLPMITGWAPFRSAEKLSGQARDFVVDRSVESLAKALHLNAQQIKNALVAAHFHDWQTDPFSRGAYSYGKVGSDGSQQTLAAPVDNALFFAGEATDIIGYNGTVHGAIASGYRAAAEILQTITHHQHSNHPASNSPVH